jgi:hypothetical protein
MPAIPYRQIGRRDFFIHILLMSIIIIIILLIFVPLLLTLFYFSRVVSNRTVQLIIERARTLGRNEYYHFKELPVSYWLTSGNKHYPSINNIGEVFVYNDFILVLRKQRFLNSHWLKPLVVSHKNVSNALGNSIESYTPKKFTYWELQRKEVQIQLADRKYSHISVVLTLKELTSEQINNLKSFEKRINPIDFTTTNR